MQHFRSYREGRHCTNRHRWRLGRGDGCLSDISYKDDRRDIRGPCSFRRRSPVAKLWILIEFPESGISNGRIEPGPHNCCRAEFERDCGNLGGPGLPKNVLQLFWRIYGEPMDLISSERKVCPRLVKNIR